MAPLESDASPGDLGEMDSEEEFIFPPAERRIVTQPLDLSVQTLIEQWEAKTLLLPDIQREYVWDNGKSSRLIESLILNIPIPTLYFAENQEAKYEGTIRLTYQAGGHSFDPHCERGQIGT